MRSIDDQEFIKNEIFRMKGLGISDKEVCKHLNIDRTTLWSYKKKLHIQLKDRRAKEFESDLEIYRNLAVEKAEAIIRQCELIVRDMEASNRDKLEARQKAYEACIELVLLSKGQIKFSGGQVDLIDKEAESTRDRRDIESTYFSIESGYSI